MDFSDPFVGMTPGKKLSTEELLRALRISVASELDAINIYQAVIDCIDDENVKQVFAHIRDEEKEHYAEFTAAVNYLDVVQREKFTEPHPELGINAGVAQVVPSTPIEPVEEEPHAAGAAAGGQAQEPVSTAPQFSVGSLFGQQQAPQPSGVVGNLLGKPQM